MKHFNVVLLATVCALTACSANQTSAELDRGIHTSGIGQAPLTETPTNNSLPLSATNTPDAIAAKQTSHAAPPSPQPNPAHAAANGAAVAAAPLVATVSYASGASVMVRDGAVLRSRPTTGIDAEQSPVFDSQVKLSTHIYNAQGHWWFVEAGKETGWIQQADFLTH